MKPIVRALRLIWLKRIVDVEGGLFFFECNYDANILPIFYHGLLSWWAELREIIDPYRGYEYISWSNKVVLIEGKTVFYRHYFNNGVIFIKDLLYDIAKLEQ